MTQDQLDKLRKTAKAITQAALEMHEFHRMLEEHDHRYFTFVGIAERWTSDASYLVLLADSLK